MSAQLMKLKKNLVTVEARDERSMKKTVRKALQKKEKPISLETVVPLTEQPG